MGGGGSKCSKVDRIDQKPTVTPDVGVTIAASRQCDNCNLVVSSSSSSSVITLSRKEHTLILAPAVPLSVNFNGTTAVFNEVRLFAPAPTSIEHVNADAVLHCVSDTLWLFIPLRAANSGNFLTSIVGVLDPATSEGLGIVDPKTKKYGTATAAPGAEWSIASLVNGATDPYFTWINGSLEQYTISDGECERHIGWKSTDGPRVLYFQNLTDVATADIAKLRETIGTVLPADVGLSITDTMYFPGQRSCPPKMPKLKLPTFYKESAFAEFAVWFGILLIAFLAIVAAVSLSMMENGPIQYIGRGIYAMFGGDLSKAKPPSPGLGIPTLSSVAALASGKLPSLSANTVATLSGR